MRQLFPNPLDPVDPAAVYGDPPRAGPGGRPGVRLNMIASVDGATTVAGVSGGLGGSADHDLFMLLRSLTDVVLVAAGTVRAEGYGPSRVPVAVVTRSCRLDWEAPFFTSPIAHPIVVTVAEAPPAALSRAAEVAEGGPSLNAQLAAAGLLDELCLSLSPRLVGGPAKRILDGLPVPGPAPCAWARSVSRTGSCSCATGRGRVARLRAMDPLMYGELAGWWPLLSAPASYAEEAEIYRRLLVEAGDRPPVTVLELGSGGGSNASHLKAHFQLTLVDRSEGMLEVSRELNPECEHLQGDMRTVRLGRSFDAVFVHDAINYMTTTEDLAQALATAFVHCRPGGVALFAPDHLRETFRTGTDWGGHDGDRGRGARFLEWTWDPDPLDSTCTVDYAYLLREADGSVRVEHDRHLQGLFPRATWLRLLEEAGFRARAVPVDHSELEPGTYELFVATRSSTGAAQSMWCR